MKTTRTSSRGRAAKAPKRRAWLRRARRFLLVGLAALLVAPALPIAAMRVVPPLGSALMLQRWAEARAAGRRFELAYDWVPIERIAPALRAAVVASEDQRFYEHRGFDFRAMRGAVDEWRDGERLRGASTISQQLAKNLFLWPDRSLLRKALEAWLTAWLEALWPKERILEVYLNVVELGDGVFGAEAAARRHFGHGAASLDRREAALLAAMLPSPRRSNPRDPSPTLHERQRWILRQL